MFRNYAFCLRSVSYFFILAILCVSCISKENKQILEKATISKAIISNTSIVILGTVQDAGFPQSGCMKSCCKAEWDNVKANKLVTSLGLIDRVAKKTWLFEATLDFKLQTKILSNYMNHEHIKMPNGIFLTHGHIGHYTGLIHLGREAMNANKVTVYAMPKMKSYLKSNGPWSQLVNLNNIDIQQMTADVKIPLTDYLNVTPFLVPHRAEYTETVGYLIEGPSKKALFIPDIDKWHLWSRNIKKVLAKVDFAFLDATFFKNGEIGNRDMTEIPHPFMEESMQLFNDLSKKEKAKVYFIHFNHTNPILQEQSLAKQEVLKKGYRIAERGTVFQL